MKKRRGDDILTGWASLFLIFNFTIHIAIGIGLMVAGAVVAIDLGEVVSSLGLFGAASFALYNGIEGFIDLFKSVIYRVRYKVRA